jgi:hypothetical protein
VDQSIGLFLFQMVRLTLSVVALLLLAGDVRAQDRTSLPTDTRLIIRITAPITSATANVGDLVEAALVEHRPPGKWPDMGKGFLPPGTPVAGTVEHVQRAERGKGRAELRIVFRDVGGFATPAMRINARLLMPDRRHELTKDGTLTVRDVSRGTFVEEGIFGAPLGAGVGLLAGRRGWTAAAGAAAVFLWRYLPNKLGTTNDRFADVDLRPGAELSLYIQ